MKYVSIDIETTSLEPSPDHILMVAMVVEDTEQAHIPVEELPHFTAVIHRPVVTGQPYALAMNAWLLKMGEDAKAGLPTKYDVYLEDWQWVCAAETFLYHALPSEKRYNAAGKNAAGFDLQFMPPSIRRLFRHRVIDVGSVCVDWSKDTLPSLGDLTGGAVAHDALEDAHDVIRVLRRKYAT